MTQKLFTFLLLMFLMLKNAAVDCEAAEIAKKDAFWQDMKNLSMSTHASVIQNQELSKITKAPPVPELPMAAPANPTQDTKPNPQNADIPAPLPSAPESAMQKLKAPTLESLKSLQTQAKKDAPKEVQTSINSLSLPKDPIPPAAGNATEEVKPNIAPLDQKISSPVEEKPEQNGASPATPSTAQVKAPAVPSASPAPVVQTAPKKALTEKKATTEKKVAPEKKGAVTPKIMETAKEAKPAQNKTEKKAPQPITKPKVITPTNAKSKKDQDDEVPKFALPNFSDSKDETDIDVVSRKPYDYQNQLLPPNINKKRYGPQNQHIPKVFYQNEYSSLLFVATKGSDIGAIKALLSKGADINAQDMQYGYTPLMYAIVYNKFDSFRYLITNGADIQKVAYDGRTPLHIAALYDRLEMFKILVSVGANLFALDHAGLTPYEASGTSNNAIAITLASQYENMNQALLDCAFIGATACVQYAINKGANINHKNMHRDTALTMAINKRHSAIVSLLIANGANINQKGINGLSAKDLAYAIGDQQVINTVETAIVQKELQDLR